jgi:hypothetical protein
MTDRDESFWPESLQEQLDQLARAASHSTRTSMQDARLEEDLRTVYTEYTRAGERVWARLAEHLAEQDQTPRHARRIASESVRTDSFAQLQVEQGQFAAQSAPQSTSPRRSRRFFTLVAAVLVAAVLVGSVFFVFTSLHLPGGGTIGASATPTATPTPVLTFPCPQQGSTPQTAYAADFYTLCQEHKIQVIQQSFKLKGKQMLTLVAGYADSSSVILWFHVDKNPSVTLDGSASSPQQVNGPGNFSLGTGGCSFGNPSGPLDCLEFFALYHVPAGLHLLDLEIQESVGTGSQDQAPVIAVFRVSLSVHADHSAHPN